MSETEEGLCALIPQAGNSLTIEGLHHPAKRGSPANSSFSAPLYVQNVSKRVRLFLIRYQAVVHEAVGVRHIQEDVLCEYRIQNEDAFESE